MCHMCTKVCLHELCVANLYPHMLAQVSTLTYVQIVCLIYGKAHGSVCTCISSAHICTHVYEYRKCVCGIVGWGVPVYIHVKMSVCVDIHECL